MLWLWCFCAECWMLNALHEDSSCEKKHAWLLMWCCENCAIAEGCLLEVSWPFLAYEKHTWCWGGYFRFTLSKARLFTCAAMQPMLSGVAVRGRIWHAAHALARDKSVLSSLWGKNQVDYYGEPRNFGHLFFQTLKRAHFLKSGRKKWYTFLCTNGRFGCFNASTPSDGDWAKPQKPRMSAHSRMLWRVNRLMVIGQGRKNPGCQSIVFTRCEA